jgi:hypothetical protein
MMCVAAQHAGIACEDECVNRDAEAFCNSSPDCVFIDPWSDEPRLAKCARHYRQRASWGGTELRA